MALIGIEMKPRQILITDLKRELCCLTENRLMDELQDRGLVSDNAVSLSDVPASDLIRALNLLKGEL